MITSHQQIAIHLHHLRNLSYLNAGRYLLRLSLTEHQAKTNSPATPVGLIEKQQQKADNRSEFDDQHFITRVLPLKSCAPIGIHQVYVFKLDSPLGSHKQQQTLALCTELIALEGNKQRIVGTYNGLIQGHVEHEYLQIDFYDSAPCQIIGSFHRCSYKFEFSEDKVGIDLRTFCEKCYAGKIDEITDYLRNEGTRSYQSLAEHSSFILKEEVEIDCVELEEPLKFKILESQIDTWDNQTEIGSAQEEDSKEAGKKRRQKIFSITKDYRTEKYQKLQKHIHENSQKIYQLWRDLLQKLLTTASTAYLAQKATQYHKKLIQKTKQSVSSFKGSWDTDMYCEEQSLRVKLAHQLRNRNNQFYQDLHPSIHQQFPIFNTALFSQTRPIFFQEKTYKSDYQEDTQLSEVLVILVHGLGACRLDMEKMKVQMKRYYEGKMRVFISSANEGRTEWQIDNMGMRLASEIDYQLSKSSHIPKICLIGHSMGGLIIRSALPRLQKYKSHFHSLVTLSSPHLGYNYSNSTLVDIGLWFMNTVKKCTSIKEMNMTDKDKYEETFLYRLSQKPGLEWFKKIVILGSHQDSYVPYYSARIQKHEQSLAHERDQVKKGKIHCQMVNNILSRAKGCVMRLDVNFCIPEQNIDTLIGRTAHINFINNTEMIRTFVLAGQHYFF